MKVKYRGKEIEAIPVDILSQEEFFNTYQLVDGSVIRLKVVVKDILKAQNELSADGNPIYIIQSENVIHLRKV